MKKLKIRHTAIARKKLKEIYNYSCDVWGDRAAKKYMMDIEKLIQQAAVEHGGKRNNPEFSTRFSFSMTKKHYLFFDIQDDTLILATIFHTAMNIENRLKQENLYLEKEINKALKPSIEH